MEPWLAGSHSTPSVVGWLAVRSPGTSSRTMRRHAAILRIVLNIMATFFFLSTTAPKKEFRHGTGEEAAHHSVSRLHPDVM